jgi:hypothetical protein
MQEAQLWLSDRYGRIELITTHSLDVIKAALVLVQAELKAIRLARAQFNV